MNASEFINKWKKVTLTERSACQQHFLDLCDLVDHPKPAQVDKTGESFTFERGAAKRGGGAGWADVWKRGFFGWEYKGKRKNLDAAYDQLLQYREALENPPILVVSDMDRILVHTNFTNTPAQVHELLLSDLGTARGFEVLRAVFHDPEKLRPGVTSQAITAEAAERIGQIALKLRERGEEPQAVARFLDRLVFCMFAEDIGLLQDQLFSKLVTKSREDPVRFGRLVSDLFKAMADGGDFGMDEIRHFNGALFTDHTVLDLARNEIAALHDAARLDWSSVDPSIFGTLFERGLDPDKRSQLGAHYTSREDIEKLVEPVVMKPLRYYWNVIKEEIEAILAKNAQGKTGRGRKLSAATLKKNRNKAVIHIRDFLRQLSELKILDPACGSGNFLYVTLQKIKDLEKEVILFAASRDLGGFLPFVHPKQLYGIEISPYAFELAQLSVWIGYIQWIRVNGYGNPPDPILETLKGNFRYADAILDSSIPENPKEPEWPTVDFIVGNPPFLGGKLMRSNLSDNYVDRLFLLWKDRVPAEADLCAYWLEKARSHIQAGKCKRAGLLATQGIRGGANRQVVKRIKKACELFFAESDRPWILDGAHVHISMLGFKKNEELVRGSVLEGEPVFGLPREAAVLDGHEVCEIHANLTSAADITQAKRLRENLHLSFMGDTKGGAFNIDEATAVAFLNDPNPHNLPNSDVVVPWTNGLDVTRRNRSMWIVDFGLSMQEAEAARFARSYRHVQDNVKTHRATNKRESYRRLWWIHVEPRPAMRAALAPLPRFLATPTVSKHRLFVWLQAPTLPDHQLIVFSCADDYFFGVMHSKIHEVWSRAQATQLREAESGTRYTPTTCFETFPFPWPPGKESPSSDPHVAAIASSAGELDALRSTWLNPPDWVREEALEFPASIEGPWSQYVDSSDDRGVGLARYPRLVPKDDDCARKLAKRTLTNLYNENPEWLRLAHEKLDEAVFAAYREATGDDGWQHRMADEGILENLLLLNAMRASVKGDVPRSKRITMKRS